MLNESPAVHLIDDDGGVRTSLAFVLEMAGFPTRTHASALDFLEAADTLEQGCIVTDVHMPQMNGMELVEQLKSRGLDNPVIVITGHADVPMAIQALHAGVSDFIQKPFNHDVILSAVRTALARQRDQQQRALARADIARRLATLSRREREVMEGLVDGKVNKVIGQELDISARTVEVYRANVMAKMGAATLPDLVRMVMITRLT